MPENVGVEALAAKRRASLYRSGSVCGDATLDGVAAQSPAGAGWEERVLWSTASLGKPGGQHRLTLQRQRHGALLATLALAPNVTANAEHDIAAVEPGDLGDSEASLGCEHEHRSVAATFPSGSVGRIDEGSGLVGREEGHDPLLESFRRDAQYPLNDCCVLGVAEGRIVEQRADGGQAQVTGSWTVPPVALQVVEEGRDEFFVEVVPFQRGRLLASGRLQETEE
jgi:hypothetical protein